MIGVLFDLDGVLIDSETKYTEFWYEINKIYPTGYADFAKIIKGNTLDKILNTYFPNNQIQKDLRKRIADFESTMKYDIFPGVIEFITELKNANIPIAIVTSSSNDKMKRLEIQHPGFTKLFNCIITGDLVSKSKPNPECFLLAATKINVSPNNCIVFEDSIYGMKAGLASGAKVIALATTLTRDQIHVEVNQIIDSFNDFTIKDIL